MPDPQDDARHIEAIRRARNVADDTECGRCLPGCGWGCVHCRGLKIEAACRAYASALATTPPAPSGLTPYSINRLRNMVGWLRGHGFKGGAADDVEFLAQCVEATTPRREPSDKCPICRGPHLACECCTTASFFVSRSAQEPTPPRVTEEDFAVLRAERERVAQERAEVVEAARDAMKGETL